MGEVCPIENLFGELISRKTPKERQEYLRIACGDDQILRYKLEKLLAAHERAGSFLGDKDEELIDDQASCQFLGTSIGPYKLREQIGEGGMGVVYVAEQTEPVKRKVALKIIKPGMASRDVVARFEAERQALAMMDHPNIAKVFDAGTTGDVRGQDTGDRAQGAEGDKVAPKSSPSPDPCPPSPHTGQPYFVMELVQGPPITEYCDQHKLSTRERLELFEKVCRAVQHAHQKGVIHRDIKPSNVLVPRIDGQAVPKVIDFGVAKAIGQKLTEQTVYTQFSQLVGTPLYMSPQQAEFGVVDIDTRSDVYSLGVLLYELLTGSTPFDSETLKQAGFDEMRRIIREDEPPRPSARVSTLAAQALSTVAERRASDAHSFGESLKGELDWLVMRALEKDRNRRYESPSALAADVERYLQGEPVEACPPSNLYRLRKFATRNKAALTTAAIVILALLLGIAGTSWQAWRATNAVADRDKALASARANLTTVEVKRKEAEANLKLAKEALAITAPTIWMNWNRESIIPEHLRNRPDLLIDILTRALELEPNNAGLWNLRATTYLGLGNYEAALRDHSKAIELAPDDAAFWSARATTHREFDNLEQCIEDLSQSIQLEPNNARHWRLRGRARLEAGQFSLAVDDLTQAIQLAPEHGGPWELRATAYEKLGDYQQALDDWENCGKRTDNDREVACNNHSIAWLLATCPQLQIRDPVRAVELARKATDLDPEIPVYWSTLGMSLYRCGDYAEALAAQERAMELSGKGDGWDYFILALTSWQLGKRDNARSYYEQAVSWMSEHASEEEELTRLREETELLLEVSSGKSAMEATPQATNSFNETTDN